MTKWSYKLKQSTSLYVDHFRLIKVTKDIANKLLIH